MKKSAKFTPPALLELAPGVQFDQMRHEYFYRGKKLSGVTGLINKHTGTYMPAQFVGEAQGEGLHVHRTVERWIMTKGSEPVRSVHPGVLWLTSTLVDLFKKPIIAMYAEVLVSDFDQYASSIDIVAMHDDKTLSLVDTKRTFKRRNVTLQLSFYKYFVEKFSDYKVTDCYCAAFRDKEYYDIFPKTAQEVEAVLYKKEISNGQG